MKNSVLYLGYTVDVDAHSRYRSISPYMTDQDAFIRGHNWIVFKWPKDREASEKNSVVQKLLKWYRVE